VVLTPCIPSQESVPEGSSSLVNEREAEMVLQLYRELRHRHPQLGKAASVAVISPYKAQVGMSHWWCSVRFDNAPCSCSMRADVGCQAGGCLARVAWCVRTLPSACPIWSLTLFPLLQVSLLRRLFKAGLGEEAAKLVDINTIDGFQVGPGAASPVCEMFLRPARPAHEIPINTGQGACLTNPA
jgi:hypothetical protein